MKIDLKKVEAIFLDIKTLPPKLKGFVLGLPVVNLGDET
jgi:hypothetical protein